MGFYSTGRVDLIGRGIFSGDRLVFEVLNSEFLCYHLPKFIFGTDKSACIACPTDKNDERLGAN